MLTLTPNSGSLEISAFDDPPPKMTMSIRIEFLELMDPEEPKCSQRVNAEFDDIAFPFESWRDLANSTISEPIIEDLSESTIYFRGYHNPIELTSVSFEQFQGSEVGAILRGTIDFGFEGLGELGTPEFKWKVSLHVYAS